MAQAWHYIHYVTHRFLLHVCDIVFQKQTMSSEVSSEKTSQRGICLRLLQQGQPILSLCSPNAPSYQTKSVSSHLNQSHLGAIWNSFWAKRDVNCMLGALDVT